MKFPKLCYDLREACMNNEDEMEILTRYAKRAEEYVAAEREEAARGLLGFLGKRKERGACP